MDKYDKYGSFQKWKNINYDNLLRDYKSGKNCADSRISTDDISFDDFCLGRWQWL